MIPLLLNDIPLLIGRIVIFRLDNHNHPTLGLSPTLPLTRQLSYFFLMKNLLVVVLSVGNMYLHCKDRGSYYVQTYQLRHISENDAFRVKLAETSPKRTAVAKALIVKPI